MIKYIAFAGCALAVAVSLATMDRQTLHANLSSESRQINSPPSRIFATGLVEGATEAVELRMETSGPIAKVCVSEGDEVNVGDLLVKLDGRREQHRVAASAANVNLAKATLTRLRNGARDSERAEARALLGAKEARLRQARVAKQRIDALRNQNAVPQQEADDKSSEVEALQAEVAAARARVEQLVAPAREDEIQAAQARVDAAEAEFNLAKLALEKTELRAPMASQVLDISVKPGEMAHANSIQPAVVLADSKKLRIRAYVEEIDAPRVELGSLAQVTADGLGERRYDAVVSKLGPQMKAKSISSGLSTEMFDTKVREVLLDLADGQDGQGLIIGLRVDVLVSAESTVSRRAQ